MMKTRVPSCSNPCTNLGILLFAGAMVLIVGAPVRAHAQCTYAAQISDGGLYCISATSTLGNSPQMPVLSYNDGGTSCETDSYTMTVEYMVVGDDYLNSQTFGLYESGDLAGNVQWVVNWSNNLGDMGYYSEGGQGQMQVSVNGDPPFPVADFDIGGQNPSTSSITAVIVSDGAPWWYGHTLTWESGNRQFYPLDPSSYYYRYPIFGTPDGFGLSQLDGSTNANPTLVNDTSIWTWTINLQYGVQVANQHKSAAQSHFQNQMAQMLSDTGGSAIYPNPVQSLAPPGCNITWNGTGNNAYWNADWINLYNGGYWATWTGTAWSYGNAVNPNYAQQVCNSPSQTI